MRRTAGLPSVRGARTGACGFYHIIGGDLAAEVFKFVDNFERQSHA
jgi:hypothetical protein